MTALGRCDECMKVDFKNSAGDTDIMCLKQEKGPCIFTGNLVKDSSYFAVTATNPRQCRPFGNDPLEVRLLLTSLINHVATQLSEHSLLGLVLTFNISTIRETLFFRCGIVIRIILNAYFPPLLSLPFT